MVGLIDPLQVVYTKLQIQRPMSGYNAGSEPRGSFSECFIQNISSTQAASQCFLPKTSGLRLCPFSLTSHALWMPHQGLYSRQELKLEHRRIIGILKTDLWAPATQLLQWGLENEHPCIPWRLCCCCLGSLCEKHWSKVTFWNPILRPKDPSDNPLKSLATDSLRNNKPMREKHTNLLWFQGSLDRKKFSHELFWLKNFLTLPQARISRWRKIYKVK